MNDSLNEKEIQKKVRREAFKRNWLFKRGNENLRKRPQQKSDNY